MVAQKAQAKKERGEGPMVVTYGNAAGAEDLKRPRGATKVVVLQRQGGVKQTYDLSQLPQSVKDDMVAYAFAARIKTYVVNHSENGADVISLVNGVWDECKAGNLYQKAAEGGGAKGRPFDAEKWATIWRNATAAMAKKGVVSKKTNKPIQPVSDKQYADMVASLTAASKEERKKKLDAWKANGFFIRALKEYEFKNTEIDEEDSDLF